jgi:hypothetical protein
MMSADLVASVTILVMVVPSIAALFVAEHRNRKKVAAARRKQMNRVSSRKKRSTPASSVPMDPMLMMAGLGVLYLANRDFKKKPKKDLVAEYVKTSVRRGGATWSSTTVVKTPQKPTKTCEYCDSPAFAHQTHCEPCGAPLPKR